MKKYVIFECNPNGKKVLEKECTLDEIIFLTDEFNSISDALNEGTTYEYSEVK